MANEDLIQALNQQLNREVSTFLRYMLQAASIKGATLEPVRQMYLAEAETPRGPYIFLTVFDQATSLGLVRMYFEDLRSSLASAAPRAGMRVSTTQ